MIARRVAVYGCVFVLSTSSLILLCVSVSTRHWTSCGLSRIKTNSSLDVPGGNIDLGLIEVCGVLNYGLGPREECFCAIQDLENKETLLIVLTLSFVLIGALVNLAALILSFLNIFFAPKEAILRDYGLVVMHSIEALTSLCSILLFLTAFFSSFQHNHGMIPSSEREHFVSKRVELGYSFFLLVPVFTLAIVRLMIVNFCGLILAPGLGKERSYEPNTMQPSGALIY